MFICSVTGKVSKSGEPQLKVVVETRPVVYENYDSEGSLITSCGTEIVREIIVSREGYDKLMGQVTLGKVS
jgi:hypothetical protein